MENFRCSYLQGRAWGKGGKEMGSVSPAYGIQSFIFSIC